MNKKSDIKMNNSKTKEFNKLKNSDKFNQEMKLNFLLKKKIQLQLLHLKKYSIHLIE